MYFRVDPGHIEADGPGDGDIEDHEDQVPGGVEDRDAVLDLGEVEEGDLQALKKRTLTAHSSTRFPRSARAFTTG